jgi:hypothetical protein
MNQADPLSARMIPYFFIARRITCTSAGNDVMSNDALRRKRSPMRGYCVPVSVEA